MSVTRNATIGILGLAAMMGSTGQVSAQGTPSCPTMRKINVGVAVAPPNVVHTGPYVAKAMGFFAKRCIEVNVIQFDGGVAGAVVTAIAQGTAIASLQPSPIANGVKAKEIWQMAPRPPQSYLVTADIKSPADLKGKRLSAAGGVGGFNWLRSRDALKKAGLTINDATMVSQGTAGRLPGFLAGQLDAVVAHPEDVFIAQQRKPGAHVLFPLSELVPLLAFNAYGAANDWIAKDRPLLRDTIAALIEANRAMYEGKDRDKLVPVIMEATGKPRDAVEFAIGDLVKRCIWSVNEGFERERTEWTMQDDVDNGDVPKEKKLAFEQIAELSLAKEAVDLAGGRKEYGACKS